MAVKAGKITELVDHEAISKDLADGIKKVEKFYEELGRLAKEGAISGTTGGGGKSSNISQQKSDAEAINKIYEKQAKVIKELTVEELKLKEAEKEKAKQAKISRDATNQLLPLAQQLAAAEKQLAARYKETALAQGITSKAAKAALKDYKQLHKQITDVDRSMGNYRDNVGNYASALQGFGGKIGNVGGAISGVTQKLATSPWVLVTAVVVSAAAAMVASLKNVDSASDAIAESWEGMTRVGTVLTDRLANITIGLGKMIMGDYARGIGQVGEAVSGLGDALTRAAIAGQKYAAMMDNIEEANTQFITKEAQLRNEAAKLIEVYQDNTKGAGERKAALTQAMDYEKEIYSFKKSMAEKTYRAKLMAAEGETGLSTKILDWIVKNDRETVLSRAKTDNRVRKAYEKLYGKDGALAKSLQEASAAVLNADSEEFEGKKKALAKLSNFQKEINEKAAKDMLLKKTEAFAKEKQEINDVILEYLRLSRAIRGTGPELRKGPATAQVNTGVSGAPDKMEKVANSETIPANTVSTDNTASDKMEILSAEASVWNQRIQLAASATSQIDSIVNASFDNRIAKMDQEATADQLAKDKELAAADGNTRKIKEINAKYDAKEKEREKEKRRVQKEQARYQKTSATVQAVINTALSVTSMLANPGGVLGIVLAALALATGIAEVAVIQSQPLPSYKKGTKGTRKDEVAKVHAGELIRYPSGEVVATPDTPESLAYLPKGTQVIPHDELMNAVGQAASIMPTYQDRHENSMIAEQIAGLHGGFAMLNETVKNKVENHISITERGLRVIARRGAVQEEWINERVSL